MLQASLLFSRGLPYGQHFVLVTEGKGVIESPKLGEDRFKDTENKCNNHRFLCWYTASNIEIH